MLKKLFISLISLISIVPCGFAQSLGGGDSGIPGIDLQEDPPINDEPNSGQTSFRIYCVYNDGYLCFVLPENIENATVTVYNAKYGIIEMITPEEPSILIALPEGIYNIECILSNGRRFIGKLKI